MTIGLVVHFDEIERQVLFQLVDNQPGPAVTSVDHDGFGLERSCRYITQQVIDIGGNHFQRLISSLFRRITEGLRHPVTDVIQAVVGTDRARVRPHHLHAIVITRVVAGGDHDAAVHFVMAGGEVDQLGTTKADVENVGTGGHKAGAEGVGDFTAGQPDVVADDDSFRPRHFHIGATDAFSQLWVELVRHSASKVIGFKTGQIHCH